MMLVSVLVVTALLVSDMIWTHSSLELERTQHHLEKHELSREPCDENWFNYSLLNSCYQFFSDKKTWEEAQDFCNQDQRCGQLASVYSAEHNIFISNMIKFVNQSRPKAWIGLNDICKEGNFTWIDGSLYSYRMWGNNEPNNDRGKEDCVNIHRFNCLKLAQQDLEDSAATFLLSRYDHKHVNTPLDEPKAPAVSPPMEHRT
ncbi:C-type lectin LmsL-like isoform X1 [Hypanus sabinus]|uniref:C-type lectin LmsL-like isoform X1 n=1 Tax=Hypanus sabinus TaxID=79690 RepID=UPI0028C3858F|nr:C-type lectin LmsL-like isoform X1 [Hypanus sabinus]XP_059842830.1 C-type lectin LmsL-like isoform X1 [Hypanus sabinus]